MKRFTWIFIALFCTALAQVPTVPRQGATQESCGCCEKSGACGMPDCAPAPMAGQPVNALSVARVVQAPVRQLASIVAEKSTPFYARFVSIPVATPAVATSRLGVPAANVPLFKVHCSFLI